MFLIVKMYYIYMKFAQIKTNISRGSESFEFFTYDFVLARPLFQHIYLHNDNLCCEPIVLFPFFCPGATFP